MSIFVGLDLLLSSEGGDAYRSDVLLSYEELLDICIRLLRS